MKIGRKSFFLDLKKKHFKFPVNENISYFLKIEEKLYFFILEGDI